MNHLANELVLVDAARAGNSDAFASLVSPYNQNVYRLAVNITSGTTANGSCRLSTT